MALKLSKILNTDFDDLVEVEPLIDELTVATPLDEDTKSGLLLCASEAVTNAMLHGNKMDPDKKVKITAEANGKEVRFTVLDEGDGFNPDDIPNPLAEENLLKPSGRGVFLMRTYCDEVIYEKNGTQLTLIVRA
jgi:serine/threonine-protein kinase RsbW